MDPSHFLPVLSQSDVDQAALLIQQAYAPVNLSAAEQQQLQRQLFEIQKSPQAWGLILPFIDHQDPNVQFFGAHTAQVKIARDWATFPPEHALLMRDLLLDLAGRSSATRKSKITLRKLYVAITALALRIAPGHPSQWPDWLPSSVAALSQRGASSEQILEFLAIAVEEVSRSDLLGPNKITMDQSLRDAVPEVIQAIVSSVTSPNSSSVAREAALKCLEAWISWGIPADNLTPLIPLLISLLNSPETFIPASDVLIEVIGKSSLAEGAGRKVLTDPLLEWMSQNGPPILSQSLSIGEADETSHAFCKLLTAIGEHSTSYFATNLSSPLIQTFLRLMLGYTGFPGYGSVDEEESEGTLAFWYLLQEGIWSAEYGVEDGVWQEEWDVPTTNGNPPEETGDKKEEEMMRLAKELYAELVVILRRKVTYPSASEYAGWSKERKDKFAVYRRDVGDTLINAYYVLRDGMLESLVLQLESHLASRSPHDGWQEVEATLHCIKSAQEAVPLSDNMYLSRTFSAEVLSALPSSGTDRVRWTAISLIGAYSTWFTTQETPLLLGAMSYVVPALNESALCLQAATALKDLCDANRSALAPHISAFGELHAGLERIPETEKSKVLQSIASVIQALPDEEAIAPIEAIVSPVVAKLTEALNSANLLPDDARTLCIHQLQALMGCAKGLTKSSEPLAALEDPESSIAKEQAERTRRAREDPRMVRIRSEIVSAIHRVVEIWSTDSETGTALSDLIKAITALPADATLLSLEPAPLLELTCVASRRQLTAVWLSLASMLIVQLDPPSWFTLKSVPSDESKRIVANVLPALLEPCLQTLGQPGAMEANPDIVQAFFSCMDSVALHFVAAFYELPQPAFDAVIHCAVSGLALQERYSLVYACNFLATLIRCTLTNGDLDSQGNMLIANHGRSIMHSTLLGIAAVSPRTTIPNLAELLSNLTSRRPKESRTWMNEILFSDEFAHPRATQAVKEKFIRTLVSAKSAKKSQNAAQEFSLITRGLEGTSFGYASTTIM